jgi:hypothetical protein
MQDSHGFGAASGTGFRQSLEKARQRLRVGDAICLRRRRKANGRDGWNGAKRNAPQTKNARPTPGSPKHPHNLGFHYLATSRIAG